MAFKLVNKVKSSNHPRGFGTAKHALIIGTLYLYIWQLFCSNNRICDSMPFASYGYAWSAMRRDYCSVYDHRYWNIKQLGKVFSLWQFVNTVSDGYRWAMILITEFMLETENSSQTWNSSIASDSSDVSPSVDPVTDGLAYAVDALRNEGFVTQRIYDIGYWRVSRSSFTV